MIKEEDLFRKDNEDIHIPKEFNKVLYQYANLPEYLRRWCVFKHSHMTPKEKGK